MKAKIILCTSMLSGDVQKRFSKIKLCCEFKRSKDKDSENVVKYIGIN